MAFVVEGLRRGGKVLIWDGYRYQKNKETANKIYWRCTNVGCRAPIQTNNFDMNDENARIRIRGIRQPQHSHEKDEESIVYSMFVQDVLTAIEEDPSLPTRRAYNDVLVADHDYDEGHIPSYERLETRLKRFRRSLWPRVPGTIQDVQIDGVWSENWAGQPLLRELHNNAGIAVFSTPRQLRVLGICPTVMIDGTFRTAPHPYRQIVTVHGHFNGYIIPLAMCLSTGKQQHQYEAILQALKREILAETGQAWAVQRVITDFEIALIEALRTELPNADRKGCFFHFCSSIYRKVQELGLAGPYQANARLKTCIRKLMALGFLPLLTVRQAFVTLTTGLGTRRLIRRYPALGQLIRYFERTYIIGNIFPRLFWNVWSRSMAARTNNAVESFHNKWNRIIGQRHPSLWVIIRKIKDEAKRSHHVIRRANRGDDPPRRRKKWRCLERRIKRLKRQYRQGQRTLQRYHCAIVYAIKAFGV